jgi:hypothetical protein
MNCCSSLFRNISLCLIAIFISSTGISSTKEKIKAPFEPDHYISYDIELRKFKNQKVELRDQFISFTTFNVLKPTKLLNPTIKRHANTVTKVRNKYLHYAAYPVTTTAPVQVNATVKVSNQFGDFVINSFKPEYLLAPTLKTRLPQRYFSFELEPSDVIMPMNLNADHYLCYEIRPQTVLTGGGFLRDQFRGREFDLLVARHLCNPVDKIHGRRLYRILHPDDSNHLMCFDLKPLDINRRVLLSNQFGVRAAAVLNDDELCVPSVKVKIHDQCEGSTPNSDGMCNGACPNPNDLCRPLATAHVCACFPPEPTPCGATGPDNGECNGFCQNTTQTCQVDPLTDKCNCLPAVPTPCTDGTPDANGQCGGFCQNPNDKCLVDAAGGKCECVPPQPRLCTDGTPDANGQCGGFCQNPDDKCLVDAAGGKCECVPPQPRLCTDGTPDANGQCGGFCTNADTRCVADPTSQRCECVPNVPTCGFSPEGVCGGECLNPDAVCEILIGTNICACL